MNRRNCFFRRLQRNILVWTALSLILNCPVCVLAAFTYGDIIVSVSQPSTGKTYHGYVEYAVSVTNSSEQTAHSVTLVMPGRTYGSGDYIGRLSRSVVVPPLSSVTVSLLQPPVPMRGADMAV